MRRLFLAVTVLFAAPQAEAQRQLHTEWYVVTYQTDGTSSRIDLGPTTGALGVPAGVWRCTYATAGTIQNDLARGVTCTDGVGDVTLLTRCPANTAANNNMRATFSAAGAHNGFGIALACETK